MTIRIPMLMWRRTALPACSVLVLIGCGPGEPRTDAERMARAKELVHQMSTHLAGANQIAVTIQEVRDLVRRSGKKETVSFAGDVGMRRPDPFHVKTSGARQMEVWYDGKRVTLALHRDKVFAQAPMPETIDRTLDALAERYGTSVPVGDLFYSSPEKALLSDTTKGGYAGHETVDGVACHHLAFQDTGVDWELWLPTEGDPLPRRLKVLQKARTGKPVVDVTFVKWNLAPQLADGVFVPRVPSDYEGIAMVQRAAAAKNTASQPAGTTPAQTPPPSQR
jgi:hypothetical protein